MDIDIEIEVDDPKVFIRHAETEDDLRACWPTMRELRPHIDSAEMFIERFERMRAQSYRLLVIWRDSEVLALGGYRYQENLLYGRAIYLDDFVTRESSRGEGWGQLIINVVTSLAEDAGCEKLVLDTSLANALAQRFYFRQGLLSGAMRFSKSIRRSADQTAQVDISVDLNPSR